MSCVVSEFASRTDVLKENNVNIFFQEITQKRKTCKKGDVALISTSANNDEEQVPKLELLSTTEMFSAHNTKGTMSRVMRLSTSSNPSSNPSSTQSLRSTRKIDLPVLLPQEEYPVWLTKARVMGFIYSLPNDPWWNAVFCIYVLTHVTLSSCIPLDPPLPYKPVDLKNFLNIFLAEIPYIFQVITLICNDCHSVRMGATRPLYKLGYVLDAVSLSAPFITVGVMGICTNSQFIVLLAIALRMHRPFRYLWLLNYYLKGSVILTLFKYLYISIAMRVFYAFVFYYYGLIKDKEYEDAVSWLKNKPERLMFRSFYEVNKIFIPMGPDEHPRNTTTRMLYIMMMLTGVLVVLGIAIASLSLIIGLYMRPEEEFRSRFRLIMGDMKKTNLPVQLRKKVETFYQMFWHKQKAVSVTQLLPIYPRCLVSAIRTNIYFEAMQKSRIISDLSSPFLAEIANHMETVHYIPGDFIIKRNSSKSIMFFINYGDVELLSAEDDETALLRFTRGTILNPFGGYPDVACTRSYVAIGAATFCTAHVLRVEDLWRVAAKDGLIGQSFIIHAAFLEHLRNVKFHFSNRIRPPFKYKSNIIMLKRTLMELKEARDEDGKLLLDRTDMFINISGCYVMRNQADMSLTEEADEICLRSTFPCILQPESSLLFTWNFFVALLTVTVAFVHPYYLVFIKDVPVGFNFFNYMVTFIYILDTIVHLSTATKVEEGVPLTFMQTSSEQMKNCWFVINVISILPIFELINDGHYSGINKLARLPQVFKTLKYLEDLCVYHSNVLRFFSFFLLSVILTYLAAALQQFFGCTAYGYCLVTNFTSSPYWEKKPLDNGAVAGRLTYGLYSAISIITFTTHKTAQFAKSLWRYQLFMLILLEVCCVVHILIEGTYSATIMVTESMRDQYKTCIETVKTFLVKINMDPILRHRFINYLQLCWHTDKAYAITHEKNSILFDLPPHVNEDILTMQRSKYFLSIPFMKFLPNDVLKKISSQARLFYTARGEILLNTGDIGNEIYIIKEGVCEVLDPKTKNVVRLLSAKGYFGDLECLLRLPAYFSVRAVTNVHLYTISRKHLEQCVTVPKIKDAINYAKEQAEYSSLLTAQKAFLKYELPPQTPNREYFPLKRKHESDFEFLHPFTKFGYLSVLRHDYVADRNVSYGISPSGPCVEVFVALRYVFPRYTFRPDGRYLKRYELFRAACALASAIIYPTYTFLQLQWPRLEQLTWLLDISAYFDIVQRMLVGYFDQNGILIYHPVSTFTHYMRGAFIVDLMGCLPLEYLDYVRTTIFFKDNAYKIPSTYSFLMYNRLLQLYRGPHTLDILDEYIDRQDIILMIKAIPVFMALICIVTSLILESSLTKWRVVTGGWRLEFIRDPIHGNWIENYDATGVRYNITATPWNAVLTTFYWVVYETTGTGFNLFQPTRLRIMVFLIAGMLIGTVITIYYAVHVISIRANVNQALGAYQEHMEDIRIFMKREKLDKDLQRTVISHYEHHWERMGGTDYNSILKLCDQITLRTDVIIHIYGETFTKCPILPNDIPLLRNVGRAVESTYLREKMTVVEWDDVISEIYIIDHGFVKMYGPHTDTITYLPRGSVFGNLDSHTVVCPTKFVSESNVHLLKININEFQDIIEDFPAVKALMDKYRPNNENYISTGTQIENAFERNESKKNRDRNKTRIMAKFLHFFHKNPKVVQIYSIVVSILCLCGDLYNASFQCNKTALIAALYCLDFCFFLTILLKLSMPFMAEKGTDTRKELMSNRKEYRKILFKVDALSCVPIEVFCLLSRQPFTAFAFLRLNRCLRLVAINDNMTQYHKNLNINLTITTVTSVSMWFMLFVHTAACIWYYLGMLSEKQRPYSSWRNQRSRQNHTICESLYVCSLYFILTTFTLNGVGDILPQQQPEVIFVCILMIMSTIIFMIYVGEFSNIIQYQSFRYYAFYSKYMELLAFLKNNKVSENLIKITQKYTLHLWQEARGRQVPYFLKTAPQCLRLNIMSAAYVHHLQLHPVFMKCEPSFLRQLVGHLQLCHYSEDLHVVKVTEITNSMYFVHKGRVQEVNEYSDEFDDKHNMYNAGEFFGSENGLKRNVPFKISYRTIIKSQILSLCFDDWEYLLQHFPKSKSAISGEKDSFDDFPSYNITKSLKKRFQIDKTPTIHHLPSELPIEIKHSTAAGSTDPEQTINTTDLGQSSVEGPTSAKQDLGQFSKMHVPHTSIQIRDESDEDISRTAELAAAGKESQPTIDDTSENQPSVPDTKKEDIPSQEIDLSLWPKPRRAYSSLKLKDELKTDMEKLENQSRTTENNTPKDQFYSSENSPAPTKLASEISDKIALEEKDKNQWPLDITQPSTSKEDKKNTMTTEISSLGLPKSILLPTSLQDQTVTKKEPFELLENLTTTKADNQTTGEKSSLSARLPIAPPPLYTGPSRLAITELKTPDTLTGTQSPVSLASAVQSKTPTEKGRLSGTHTPDSETISVEEYMLAKRLKKKTSRSSSNKSNSASKSSALSADDKKKKDSK